MALRVGIVGVTGYVGEELVRILCHHSEVSEITAASRDFSGTTIDRVYPHLRGYAENEILGMEQLGELIDRSDVVFLALPHRVSAPVAREVIEKGKKVIDLAADFRLPEQKVYEEWYQAPHGAPELLKEAVYGLPELFRKDIVGKRLVANPGCYPTSALLALAPLLKNELVDTSSVIIDSKSGVSGAGRSAVMSSLFTECNENMKAYGLGTHRHTPEIACYAGVLAGEEVDVIFTPHLIPLNRGILSTVYAKISRPLDSCSLRNIYQEFYAGEKGRFVLDDAFCAGYLAADLRRLVEDNGIRVKLSDAAQAAYKLYQSYPDIISAFLDSFSGQRLREINLAEDLISCSQVDITEVVPVLYEKSPCLFIDSERRS
jgi:N-acetyl-gamma-glutamyl-phosphate reductase